MVIALTTSPKTVGRTNQPRFRSAGRPTPPVTRVAPSSIPAWIRRWTLSNCSFETSGPITVASSRGSPTLIASVVSFATFSASACFARGTSIRVGASQDWPVFDITALTPAATASAMLADGRMMFGLLPPSSCATRFTVGAAAAAIAVPARVEPVKDTMSTSGCEDIRAPTSGPLPFTRLNTPFGTPASCRTCAKRTPDSGAISEGFNTMVQPAMRAGATLQAIWFIGQFQGVISAQTPIPS